MLRQLLQFAALSLPFIVGSVAQAAVWQTTNSWNAQREREFGKYINELPLDYFNLPGTPYYNIPTDCADAAYALRIIFAAERGLPVDFYNHEGLDLSNSTTEFDHIADDHERLLKFIRLVRLKTDTGTLITETYPIAINRQSVMPGTMLLHSPKKEMKNGVDWTPPVLASNHVFYVQNVSESGLVTYISSTVPVAVRNMNVRNGYVYAPFNTKSGYRAWKWPGTLHDPLESRLNGSEEQFTLANWVSAIFATKPTVVEGRKAMWAQDKAWSDVVRSRLQGAGAGRAIDPVEELKAVMGNIDNGINDRINVVLDGWNAYQSKYGGQGCMSEEDYDGYSTPTRDTRIQTELAYLPAAAMRYLKSKRISPTASSLARLYSNYKYQIAPGKIISLNEILSAFKGRKALSISEPEHSPAIRWGLAEYKSSREWPCPHRAKKYLGGENF